MFGRKTRAILTFLLACAVPLATAQSQDSQREFNERQLRDRLDRERDAQMSRESQLNWDAHMYSLERDGARSQSSSDGRGGGESSALAPALLLAIIGGALIEWSRQPKAQRPVIDYVQETRRQREYLVYNHCRNTRQSSLVTPKYEKPSSWALIRMFQGDRAEAYKVALEKHQIAVAETEPTCRCVGERSTSEAGFSDSEWTKIAQSARSERPWLALDASRAKRVFEPCATHSPSNPDLSWLFAGKSR